MSIKKGFRICCYSLPKYNRCCVLQKSFERTSKIFNLFAIALFVKNPRLKFSSPSGRTVRQIKKNYFGCLRLKIHSSLPKSVQTLSNFRPRLVQSLSQKCLDCSLAVLVLNVHTLLRKNGQLQIAPCPRIVQTLSINSPKLVQKSHQYALSQYNN